MKYPVKHHLASLVKRCPGTGKMVGIRFDNLYAKIAFPLAGILGIIRFLIRVIPKPSRATYPCQHAAAGIGTSFILYLFGSIGYLAICDRFRKRVNVSLKKLINEGLLAVLSISIGMIQIAEKTFVPDLVAPEGVYNPMGEAWGISPGRVVWNQVLFNVAPEIRESQNN